MFAILRSVTRSVALAIAVCACAIAGAGCVDGGMVYCDNGLICPRGTACDEVRRDCVMPEQVAACIDRPREAPCSYPDVSDGACFDGVCLPAGCGNGEIETGEVCDDENQLSGDACSDDCMSDETCGNGYVDVVSGEQCDDGNRISHDGCASACRTEKPRWEHAQLGLPSERTSPIVYDVAHRRAVVFGSYAINPADTWEWDGRAWNKRFPTVQPPARGEHAMVYDGRRHRTILFGGR